jgi:Tfp pilus assembly protein PilN
VPKGKGKGRSQGVDLNILPENMRQAGMEVTAPSLAALDVTFWLLVVLAFLLLIPLYQVWVQAQADLGQGQAALRLMDAEVQRRKVLPAEAEKLRATLTQTVQLSWGLEVDYQSLVLGKAVWADNLEAVRTAIPQAIELASLTQKGSQISLIGSGDAQATVLLFATNLKKSPRFASVTVQSLIEPPPPTPTSAVPPTPAPRATPTKPPGPVRTTFTILLELRKGGP